MKTLFRSILAAALLSIAGVAMGSAQAVNACYVPNVGAIYLVGLTGLPTACLNSNHVAIALGGAALPDGSVSTVKIADGAVTGPKLGPAAVGAGNLAPNAVQAGNIGPNAVGSPQIAPSAVGSNQIAPNAVGTNQIAPGGVATSDLADGAVTAAKLAAGVSGLITTRSLTNGFSGLTVPGGGTFLFACKTSTYTAGPGETALIWVTASSLVPSGQGIGVRPGFNSGGSDATIGSWLYQQNSNAATTDMVNGQFAALQLTTGASYVFSTAITNAEVGASYTANNAICNTMVVIVRIGGVGPSALNLAQ